MRTRLFIVAIAAALLSAGAAFADNGNGNGNGHGKLRYSFLGQLTATPSNGGVSITVQGGNKPALRAMLGAPVTQTFAYDSNTEFLKWSAGIPTVVQPGDLAAGDFVWVHVRAARGSDLAAIEQTPAGIVGDHGTQLFKPGKPLYLFRGTLTAVGTSTVDHRQLGLGHRARHRRQPPGVEAPDRRFERRVVRLRRRHDLSALAGKGPDGDRRLEARRRRPDRGSDPRRDGLVPRAGRVDGRESRRRSRAGCEVLVQREGGAAPCGGRLRRFTKALRESSRRG